MHSGNSGPVYRNRDNIGIRLFRCVISSGHDRLYQRGSRNRSGPDWFLIAGSGTGITVWKSDIGLAGGLPTQGAAAHGFGAAAFCSPDLVRLVALVLGIVGDFVVRGSDEFRLFHPIVEHPNPA